MQDLRGKTMGGHSKRSLNQVNFIVRHHSATQSGDVFKFEDYWKSKGWQTGGYHEVILRDGDFQLNYDENVITNGVGGHNTESYHICLVGNGDFTEAQEQTFKERAKRAMDVFELSVNDVIGHNEFSSANTSCPGINMDDVRADLKGSSNQSSDNDLLRKGDDGKEVKQLQQELLDAGEELPQYGADGHFGDETEKAVKSLQRKASITIDGIVGPNTRDALNNQPSSNHNLPNGIYREGNRSGAVKKIQEALNAANFKVGPVDGIYGPKTKDAVERFQKVYLPYEVDGIYGPNTKDKLEEVL
ncbi:peptidoglycan recognition protein family protein [Alkalibacillus almallahensis]|uniref:peptidoglycan recognition protein family protein n=1 Tax=Alkalibacillus almallahensis TaxID=1379154 RepID=UPI00141E47E6|nr:N-acetylmuramoyl-L-alanine amidase [Alkalibacillus almallahensis]NIK11205.1 peptidoglycan hydrolase-like protein with peptidoglycan-binding domain [Alkalibacillus almallahensis]